MYKALQDTFATAEANPIGKELGFNIKAVQRFLTNSTLFTKIAQGQYSKK